MAFSTLVAKEIIIKAHLLFYVIHIYGEFWYLIFKLYCDAIIITDVIVVSIFENQLNK